MLRVLEYGGERPAAFRDIDTRALPGTVKAAANAPLLWVDAPEPEEADLAALGDAFAWHELIREDLGGRNERQKVEAYPESILLVAFRPRPLGGDTAFDHLYVICGEAWLVTVHDGCHDLVERVGTEVARRSDLAANGAASAVAALLGNLIEAYDRALDGLEGGVEEQESDALVSSADPVPALRTAAGTRTAVARLRRASSQLRELIGVIVRRELVDIEHTPTLDLELRDVLDNAVRVHDDLDMLHDRMSALAETRLAMVSYRQNEITKRLSGWGAILLVPTVVTGWFGQNFHHLGALGWREGPAFSALIMAVAMGGLGVVFRRIHWL